jgi:hypothetical protein
MPPTANKPETSESTPQIKSVADLQREYEELLAKYDQLTGEVEMEIRQMRGGRILNLQSILTRILKGKSAHTEP